MQIEIYVVIMYNASQYSSRGEIMAKTLETIVEDTLMEINALVRMKNPSSPKITKKITKILNTAFKEAYQSGQCKALYKKLALQLHSDKLSTNKDTALKDFLNLHHDDGVNVLMQLLVPAYEPYRESWLNKIINDPTTQFAEYVTMSATKMGERYPTILAALTIIVYVLGVVAIGLATMIALIPSIIAEIGLNVASTIEHFFINLLTNSEYENAVQNDDDFEWKAAKEFLTTQDSTFDATDREFTLNELETFFRNEILNEYKQTLMEELKAIFNQNNIDISDLSDEDLLTHKNAHTLAPHILNQFNWSDEELLGYRDTQPGVIATNLLIQEKIEALKNNQIAQNNQGFNHIRLLLKGVYSNIFRPLPKGPLNVIGAFGLRTMQTLLMIPVLPVALGIEALRAVNTMIVNLVFGAALVSLVTLTLAVTTPLIPTDIYRYFFATEQEEDDDDAEEQAENDLEDDERYVSIAERTDQVIAGLNSHANMLHKMRANMNAPKEVDEISSDNPIYAPLFVDPTRQGAVNQTAEYEPSSHRSMSRSSSFGAID